ncbi:HutD/Ves family protein [Pseudogemmobacter sp. W21_MBD1_M6]|uniref:HutD/Ves family protein n=1 Tax=Pseudogemmobacter sp. W21_MBD1_M6 TaxID=3240271 RepID=UPI003F951EC9
MSKHNIGKPLVFTFIPPERFLTSRWKNGRGVTHEIARHEENGAWVWRLSIAEVASDGPFSRFEGLARILTVIEGAGVNLHSPEGAIQARPLVPVHFSGSRAVDSRMVDGPIRDLNVIYDPARIVAAVEVLTGPCQHEVKVGPVGVLALFGQVAVAGRVLPVGVFALGSDGAIDLSDGAICLLVTLRDKALITLPPQDLSPPDATP